MTIIKREAVVPFTAQQMYELVNDVASYPSFLPYCQGSTVLKQSDNEVHASLTLAKGVFSKSFTTCNRLQPGKMIEVVLVDGPFRHLEGFWRFQDKVEGGSEIKLDLEFELAGGFLNKAFEPVFAQVANKLVDAFHHRAKDVYGTK
ncbi:MAG: type II toxin-antitoxin system RatA family toxin [Gammaproteobacteria bacterium]